MKAKTVTYYDWFEDVALNPLHDKPKFWRGITENAAMDFCNEAFDDLLREEDC